MYKLYESIDYLPAKLFRKILETKDFNLVIERGEVPEEDQEKIGEAWVSCYNEYLKIFGHGSDREYIMSLEDRVAKLKQQIYCKGMGHLKAILKKEERELHHARVRASQGGKSQSFEYDIAIIQKYNGFYIDDKTISTMMFFTYIQQMREESQKQKLKDNARLK